MSLADTRARHRSKACPTCGAATGTRCVWGARGELDEIHVARSRLYRATMKRPGRVASPKSRTATLALRVRPVDLEEMRATALAMRAEIEEGVG